MNELHVDLGLSFPPGGGGGGAPHGGGGGAHAGGGASGREVLSVESVELVSNAGEGTGVSVLEEELEISGGSVEGGVDWEEAVGAQSGNRAGLDALISGDSVGTGETITGDSTVEELEIRGEGEEDSDCCGAVLLT